jgi:peptide/nickel transport system substrate-binding protein
MAGIRAENREKSFEACTLGWTLPLESDPYQVWHSSQADMDNSSNHISFKNKEADKIIEELRVTFDEARRNELCHRFHKILHEEQPYTFLFSPDSLLAQNSCFKNVLVFPEGIPTRVMWVPENLQKPVPGLK